MPQVSAGGLGALSGAGLRIDPRVQSRDPYGRDTRRPGHTRSDQSHGRPRLLMCLSRLSCTRPSITRERCHSWANQVRSADHRLRRGRSWVVGRGLALDEDSRMIIAVPRDW